MHPKQLLSQYGIEPKKSLGQNFLFDEKLLARIVAAAGLQADDEVLEVGPGLGVLTRLLAQQARRVVAVELDARLIPILQKEMADFVHVAIIQGDILAQEPEQLFTRPYKVVANVPYYITGAILRHLLESAHKPTRLVLTVQKEVAARLTAVPPHMSILAVTTQFYGRVQTIATVKAGAFWPRPEVDSAVVQLDVYDAATRPLPPGAEAAFFRLVKAGFSQKRKQLQNNLPQLGPEKQQVRQWLAAAGIDGRRRAESLALPEWLRLYDAFRGK